MQYTSITKIFVKPDFLCNHANNILFNENKSNICYKVTHRVCWYEMKLFGSVRSSRSHNVRALVHSSVCLFGPSLSRALNIHLLASDSSG